MVIEYADYFVKEKAKIKKLLQEMGERSDLNPNDTRIQVWRKLGEHEFDGKKWIPFGMRPNVPLEQAQKAFEKQGVVTGRLAFSPSV